MSIKNNAKKKAKSKVKKIVFLVIQPFLPFIIIILVLFFSICSIIDAVFIQEVQKQDSSMSEVELELKNKCIKKAEELNMCDNYIENESTKEYSHEEQLNVFLTNIPIIMNIIIDNYLEFAIKNHFNYTSS